MESTTIRILEPGDEATLEAFLLPRVATSMFLIGNMRQAGLSDEGQRYGGTYAAALEGERIVGVVAHYWNGNLVFQAPDHAADLWPVAAAASTRGIRGLIGPDEQVRAALATLALDPSNAQKDETEVLYWLPLDELLLPEPLRDGTVRGRLAAERDAATLAEWRVAYSVEALGDRDTAELRQQAQLSTERSIGEGRAWVLEAGDRPVSCSSFNAAIQEAVQVGGVFTPPGLRGRGYGRAVVAASLLAARSGGVGTGILFTGVGNTAARRAYTALGFQRIGDYRIVLFGLPVTALRPLAPGAQ